MEVLDFTFERRLELVARDSRKEGREKTIFALVSEKDLPMAKGAEKLQLSEDEFIKKMTQAGYKLPEWNDVTNDFSLQTIDDVLVNTVCIIR